MKRSDINPMPEYFDRYINLVDDIELMEAFEKSILEIEALDIPLLKKIGNETYEPGKWTVKETLQHIIDGERIMSYRTLLFAREEPNTPNGIDFEFINVQSKAESRTIESQIGELKAVRFSTIEMFYGFDNEAMLNTGINWKYEMSVLAMGFSLIGHQVHHLKIIEEKYYPLSD